MFPRLTRVRRSPSKVDEYVQLVESYRDDHGRSRQRVVVNLGRKDQLSAQLEALVRLLDRPRRWVDSERLAAPEQAPAWGRLLALRQAFQQLGLEDILDRLEGPPPRGQARLADRVLVLAACARPLASTGWRAGWKPSSSATAATAAGCRPGATTSAAAAARGCASKTPSSTAGIAPSTLWPRTRRRSKSTCSSGCAICFRPDGRAGARGPAAPLAAYRLSEHSYTLGQLRCDLHKLKTHGLVEHLGRSYCYRLTQKGVRVALMFLLFHKHVCGPLAHSLFATAPAKMSKARTKIQAAYRQADTSVQRLADLLAAA